MIEYYKSVGGGQRDSTLDCIKGYGICLMVCGHSGFPYRDWIYLFHMALFFIASGYMWNETHAETISSLGQYIKKKIRAYYIPFVTINLFFILTFNLFFRMGIYSDRNIEGIIPVCSLGKMEFIKALLKVFIFSGGSQLAGATWFLRTLFCITISNAAVTFVFNRLHLNKVCIYCMLFVSGLGAALVNSNYLFIGDIFEKIGLRAYFAGYFAYMLGILIKKSRVIEKIKVGNSNWMLVLIVLLCIINGIGKIELNVGHIENIVFYTIASLAGWFLIRALASSTLKINSFLSYVGRKSIWILGLHFLCFKLVSIVWIRITGIQMVYLAEYPVIKEPCFLWLAYLVIGVLLPLFIEMLYRKMYYAIIKKS